MSFKFVFLIESHKLISFKLSGSSLSDEIVKMNLIHFHRASNLVLIEWIRNCIEVNDPNVLGSEVLNQNKTIDAVWNNVNSFSKFLSNISIQVNSLKFFIPLIVCYTLSNSLWTENCRILDDFERADAQMSSTGN